MTANPTAKVEATAPVAPPVLKKTVQVELVWPASRGAKIDCKGTTKIVWSAQGDVQDYPADQWYLLAQHPDVWRLVDPKDADTAAQAKVEVIETPEQKVERINREVRAKLDAKRDAAERDRLDALAAKEQAAQTNTDKVVVKVATLAAGSTTPPATTAAQGPKTLTPDDLAQMRDEDIQTEGARRGYSLHPRLNPVNLRARFLELQADAALGTKLLNTPGD